MYQPTRELLAVGEHSASQHGKRKMRAGPPKAPPPMVRHGKPTACPPRQKEDHRERSQIGIQDRTAFDPIPSDPSNSPPPKGRPSGWEIHPAFWTTRLCEAAQRVATFRADGFPAT